MKCKNCGKEVLENWAMCPFCGTPIEKKKLCAKCGAELQPNWIMCPFCGEAGLPKQTPVAQTVHDDVWDILPNTDDVGILPDLGKTDILPKTDSILPSNDDLIPVDLDNSGYNRQGGADSDYQKKLKLARIHCIRREFDLARDIYEGFIEENPLDVNAYLGLVRIATKNYSEFIGEEVDDAVSVVQEISENKAAEQDKEFAAFLSKRNEVLKQYAEDSKRRAEAQAKADAEAKLVAQAEMERKIAWRKEQLEKEKVLGLLTAQLEEERKGAEEIDKIYKHGNKLFLEGQYQAAMRVLQEIPEWNFCSLTMDVIILLAKCAEEVSTEWYFGAQSAAHYYRQAALFGSLEAQLWLAKQYRVQFKGHNYRDYIFDSCDELKWNNAMKSAEVWYLKAVEHNSLEAYKGLAGFYELELHDYKKAKIWYKKAGDMGDIQSKLALKRLENM